MSGITERYRRMAVRTYGMSGGWTARWGGYWHSFDRYGRDLGVWSTRRRAEHAIAQRFLVDFYSPHRWDEGDE